MSKLYVLDAIRAHLKARQLTYKDLALGLGLSETSVKRLFASADCSLERLEQICQFLQLEFADLFRSAPKKRALIAQLTHDQEVEFATHRHLLMVAVCALTLKSEDYLTRIYTAVGRLGVHAGETDGAWSWSVVKLVAVFNPALTGAAVAGGLRAHMIADIVANEELRERSALWQLIGDAGDTDHFGSPQQLAQSVAGD